MQQQRRRLAHDDVGEKRWESSSLQQHAATPSITAASVLGHSLPLWIAALSALYLAFLATVLLIVGVKEGAPLASAAGHHWQRLQRFTEQARPVWEEHFETLANATRIYGARLASPRNIDAVSGFSTRLIRFLESIDDEGVRAATTNLAAAVEKARTWERRLDDLYQDERGRVLMQLVSDMARMVEKRGHDGLLQDAAAAVQQTHRLVRRALAKLAVLERLAASTNDVPQLDTGK